MIHEIAFLKAIEPIVPFNVEEEKCFVLDYDDFDMLVNKHVPGVKNYEVIAYEEWGNDSSHMFRGDGHLDQYDLGEIEDVSKLHYKARAYMNYLVNAGVLPKGEYRIEVSW